MRNYSWRGRAVRRQGAYVFGLGWAVAFYVSDYGVPALIGRASRVPSTVPSGLEEAGSARPL
jgi:hypothetical protein